MSDPSIRRITYGQRPRTRLSGEHNSPTIENEIPEAAELTPSVSEDLQPVQSFLKAHELKQLMERFHHIGRSHAAFLRGVRRVLFGNVADDS